MKRFIENIKNIWKVEELRKRILLTLGLILFFTERFYFYFIRKDKKVDNIDFVSSNNCIEIHKKLKEENIQKEINQKALIILNNDFAAPAEAEPLLKTKK